MPALTYIYIASVVIAFLSSLTSFRLDYPFHLKLFSCLLGLTALVEITAGILVYAFNIHNFWLYNSFALVEFWIYGYFYLQIVQTAILKRVLFIFLLIFPIFWGITVFFVFGFTKWNSYVIIAGSFFSVLFALMYYSRIIASGEILPLRTLPEFWIATGMLIFYLGALPFFGTLNFLNKYHGDAASTLLNVLQFLDIIMYTLFSYGYLCRIINTKKS
jgi:hypothetical protein